MRRYIDADKIEYEDMLRPRGDGNYEECQIAYRDQIYDIPTADVRENVHGEWIDCTEDGYVECPFCHSATNCDGNKEELHFCFSCGAEMRGE